MENLPQSFSGTARGHAAKAVGVSGKSIDDAGDGSRARTANQAAARSARNCLYWVRLSRSSALTNRRTSNGLRFRLSASSSTLKGDF